MRQPGVTRSRPSRPYGRKPRPRDRSTPAACSRSARWRFRRRLVPSCEPSPPSGRRPRPLSSSSPAKASSRPWHPAWSNATRDVCGSFIPCLPQWWRRARPQGNGVSCTDASRRSQPTPSSGRDTSPPRPWGPTRAWRQSSRRRRGAPWNVGLPPRQPSWRRSRRGCHRRTRQRSAFLGASRPRTRGGLPATARGPRRCCGL